MQLPAAADAAVFNIGYRPTVAGDKELRIEGHALGQAYALDGCYGKHASFYFQERLRDERKFPDLEALKQAIASDIAAAQRLLKR